MKILHTVESYLPARHGMAEFVRQVSERLAAAGHDVTVATSAHPDRPATAQIEGVTVRSFSVGGKSVSGIQGDREGYQKFLREYPADVMVNFAAQQWATDLAFPLLPALSAKKVFVPTGFSALGDPAFRSYFEEMRGMFSLYDACVFCSDEYRDVQFARESGADNIAFIPVGAASEDYDRPRDPSFRRRFGIPEDDFLILHVAGYLSLAKGQVEALQIFSQSRIRKATLFLVSPGFLQSGFQALKPREIVKGVYHILKGNGLLGFHFPSQLRFRRKFLTRRNGKMDRRVLADGLSQEDKIQAFLNADLLLFPSWIECSPLVLYEAAAAGTPFLVTEVGNAAEIIRWTGGGELLPGRILDDREGSVVADVGLGSRLLDKHWNDRKKLREMGEGAREVWRRHFTWEVISARYESLYEKLLRGEDVRGQFLPPPNAA